MSKKLSRILFDVCPCILTVSDRREKKTRSCLKKLVFVTDTLSYVDRKIMELQSMSSTGIMRLQIGHKFAIRKEFLMLSCHRNTSSSTLKKKTITIIIIKEQS